MGKPKQDSSTRSGDKAPPTSGDSSKRLSLANSLISAITAIVVAIVGAKWFTPDLIRLDVLFPSKSVEILDDFVVVHLENYREREGGAEPIEMYKSPYMPEPQPVYDRATYIEHVWLKKTDGSYKIRLTTSGTAPEIKAIDPGTRDEKLEKTPTGAQLMTAELALDQSQEFLISGITPNPKMVYVYRNGYQGRNSWGGKNVDYPTNRLTFVYNFSSLHQWRNLLAVAPQACLKKSGESEYETLRTHWQEDKGIAIVEAFKLKPGDIVRVYWTWKRANPKDSPYETVTCMDTYGSPVPTPVIPQSASSAY
jgi:hypothetical protein